MDPNQIDRGERCCVAPCWRLLESSSAGSESGGGGGFLRRQLPSWADRTDWEIFNFFFLKAAFRWPPICPLGRFLPRVSSKEFTITLLTNRSA